MPFTPNTPEDLENLSDSELKIGYWFTTHRLKLRQILFWILVIFDVLLMGFSLWQWSSYLFSGYFQDKLLLQEIARPRADTIALREHFSAQPVIVQNTFLFPLPNGKNDALALVKNPNDRFVVQFDYNFDLGGIKTAVRQGFILPGEEKPIIELGIPRAAGASTAVLEIKNLRWQRFTAHQIEDMAEYLSRHLDFTVEEKMFFPPSSELPVPRLTFTLTNNTIYNYAEPRFLILLVSEGGYLGIEQIVFDQLLAGEQKMVDLRLSGQMNSVVAHMSQIYPDISIFDPRAYFKP